MPSVALAAVIVVVAAAVVAVVVVLGEGVPPLALVFAALAALVALAWTPFEELLPW